MTDNLIIDPMVLFFERQGFFLTTRQLEFCRFMFKYCVASKAAREAGYPEPAIQGDVLYHTYKDVMQAWREEIHMDRELVLAIYRRQAQAENKVLTNADELKACPEAEPVYEYDPNEDLSGKGAKGLRDVLGMDAAKGLDINMSGKIGLPASTQEMLTNAYE